TASSSQHSLIIPRWSESLNRLWRPLDRRLDDLAAPVGAAGGARHVRQLLLVALRAGHQRGRGGLPVRAARAGIAAGHPPLGNRHVSPPLSSGWSVRPISGRSALRACARVLPPRAARRTRRTAPGSPPGTTATSAVRAPPRPGTPAPGPAGRRRGSAPRRRPRSSRPRARYAESAAGPRGTGTAP